MTITTFGRGTKLDTRFTERTQEKLSKLEKFFQEDAECTVVVRPAGAQWRVEATVLARGMTYRAEVMATEQNDAVDRIVDVLVRQFRKHKTKLAKRLRADAFGHELPPEPEEDYGVVRTKTFPVKPLDVEEAILQMEMLGHRFFMFRNMDSGEINVVYHRGDGGYGLLEPTEA